MNVVFVNVPKTGGELFEQNFDNKFSSINGIRGRIYSVGHSWTYPTKIKGWLDWDFPNQPTGQFNEVMSFNIPTNTRVATIIRNPFNILIDYYKDDWAWCKKYQESETFEKFVDSYLDSSVQFHVPAFKKSLYSQLKDVNNKWIIDNKSFVLRYEQLEKDLQLFSKMTNITLSNYDGVGNLQTYNWKEYYREDQIVKLYNLWKADIEYLGYASEFEDYEETTQTIQEVKKPKVALCFSGNLRDIERTKDFWLDILSKYDVDVYGSFWDEENVEHGDTFDNFIKLYNPITLETEPYSNFKESTLDVLTPYIDPPRTLLSNLIDYAENFHTLSMWYRIWKANMLTKSHGDYDIVLRARTDSYLDNLELDVNNMFNTPVGKIRTDNFPNSEGICDIIGYGNPKIMDYYSTTFLHLMQYLNQGHYMIPPEHFLHVHLNKVDLQIRFFPSELFITRTSKGTADESYNGGLDMNEEILPSNFMDLTPNEKITWTKSIRDSLKF